MGGDLKQGRNEEYWKAHERLGDCGLTWEHHSPQERCLEIASLPESKTVPGDREICLFFCHFINKLRQGSSRGILTHSQLVIQSAVIRLSGAEYRDINVSMF